MTDQDRAQAMQALKQWFESQEIMPGDAAILMTSLIAEQLVCKSRELNELQQAVFDWSEFLTLEIAGELRR